MKLQFVIIFLMIIVNVSALHENIVLSTIIVSKADLNYFYKNILDLSIPLHLVSDELKTLLFCAKQEKTFTQLFLFIVQILAAIKTKLEAFSKQV